MSMLIIVQINVCLIFSPLLRYVARDMIQTCNLVHMITTNVTFIRTLTTVTLYLIS